jgi:hypothetical protein
LRLGEGGGQGQQGEEGGNRGGAAYEEWHGSSRGRTRERTHPCSAPATLAPLRLPSP